MESRNTRNIIIANGASVSNAINLTDTNLLGFITPAAWTTAALSIEVSLDGSTWFSPYDYTGAATGYLASPAVASAYAVDFSALLPWKQARFRSGTSAAPVNQGAERVFSVVMRELA